MKTRLSVFKSASGGREGKLIIQGEPSSLGPELGYFDFGYSTVSPILLGQMRVWQNGMRSWARWVEHTNQSQLNPSPRGDGSPGTHSPSN